MKNLYLEDLARRDDATQLVFGHLAQQHGARPLDCRLGNPAHAIAQLQGHLDVGVTRHERMLDMSVFGLAHPPTGASPHR